jgi:GNAT superfamily N-acetyltransferase
VSSIRWAEPKDIPHIWGLVLELAEYERLSGTVSGSADRLQESLFGAHPACRCRVTEEDGQIVGYALTFSTYSTFRTLPGIWLEDLYVTPSCRGRGLGKAMLQSVIEEGRREGVGRIEWSVLDWNESAIEFYRKMGAEVLPDWRFCRVSLGL